MCSRSDIAENIQSKSRESSKHVVLATFGSLGDLHPYIALALELRKRGHQPVIAANNSHRSIVEAEGIPFHAVRPDVADFGDETALMKKVMDLRSGSEFVIRQLLMPNLRGSYHDLAAARDDADLLVSNPLTLSLNRNPKTARTELAKHISKITLTRREAI